jgi:hypothetical protein
MRLLGLGSNGACGQGRQTGLQVGQHQIPVSGTPLRDGKGKEREQTKAHS